MFAVYDLACNGLRDPCGVSEPLTLTWRLASDRAGAQQTCWHVVVTSVSSGERAWDSGWMVSEKNVATYAGVPLVPGESYVWFLEACDEQGERAQGAPAAFECGKAGDATTSAYGPACLGVAWVGEEVEETSNLSSLGPIWSNGLGVGLADDWETVSIVEPGMPLGDVAQGSLLLPRGLVVVRWTDRRWGRRLELSLPPGVAAKLYLGEGCREVGSGAHTFVCGHREEEGEGERDGADKACCGG